MKRLDDKISQIISWAVGFVGAVATVIGSIITFRNGFFWPYIIVLAFETLLCFFWGWTLYRDFIHETEEKELKTKIEQLKQEKKEAEKNAAEKEHAWIVQSKREMEKRTECVQSIIQHYKNVSKMSNEMYNRIPGISESSYELLMLSKVLETENTEQIRGILQRSQQEFSNSLYTLFKQFTSNLLTFSISMIENYLRMNNCELRISATVKLFNQPYYTRDDGRGRILVYTAFRDRKTYEEHKREIGEEPYTIDGNVDFTRCIKKECYIINNAHKDDPSYMNEHTDFDIHYNCAVVVPVRAKQPDGTFKLFGYLCCDCKNPDGISSIFDQETADILFALAQIYANFLETLDANWADRYFEVEDCPSSFLEIIFKRIYNPSDRKQTEKNLVTREG